MFPLIANRSLYDTGGYVFRGRVSRRGKSPRLSRTFSVLHNSSLLTLSHVSSYADAKALLPLHGSVLYVSLYVCNMYVCCICSSASCSNMQVYPSFSPCRDVLLQVTASVSLVMMIVSMNFLLCFCCDQLVHFGFKTNFLSYQ